MRRQTETIVPPLGRRGANNQLEWSQRRAEGAAVAVAVAAAHIIRNSAMIQRPFFVLSVGQVVARKSGLGGAAGSKRAPILFGAGLFLGRVGMGSWELWRFLPPIRRSRPFVRSRPFPAR
jgi:hypothetical protein